MRNIIANIALLSLAFCSGCAVWHAYVRYNDKVAAQQQETMDSMHGQPGSFLTNVWTGLNGVKP